MDEVAEASRSGQHRPGGGQAKFDGRFVYFVGMEESGNRVQHHVMQALISAEPGRDPARPKGFPGAALSSSMTV